MVRGLGLVLLCACADLEQTGDGASIELPFAARVYQCDGVYPNGNSAGTAEYCFDGTADELEAGMCVEFLGTWNCYPTPKGLGPCVYSCPSTPSCGADYGCFCPSK